MIENVIPFEEEALPPHNIEAEQALLGALLVNNATVDIVADMLKGDHFFEPVHGRIFNDIVSLAHGGSIVTPITLKAYYESDDALVDVGGASYLARLAGSAVTVLNTADYASAIHACWVRRQVIQACTVLSEMARKPLATDTADTYITAMAVAVDDLSEVAPGESMVSRAEAMRLAGEIVETAIKNKRVVGATTGLTDLDRKIGGLENGNLIIIAGDTSMGKTVLAQAIARNVTSDRADERPGLYFSLEMSRQQIGMRELARTSGVPLDQLRTGRLIESSKDKIFDISTTVTNDDVRLWIDDEPRITVKQIHARCRKMRRIHGLGLVVVDFLQEVASEPTYRGSRSAEVSEIAYGLKYMARALQVPVILLSQLSRGHNQRDDKRPVMSDLKESGDIENAADLILLLYRVHYYQPERPHDAAEADEWELARDRMDVIIAKQRQGPRGITIGLYYDETTGTIADLEPQATKKDWNSE
jgi:replicative DNA helicase